MLNIALSILGSFKLERDRGGNSRACSWCTRKASIKTCSSYWLCQPFSIHGENYSICKFHLSWNVGHWKKLFHQFLWLTCLCFLAAWCSYASPLFLFFFLSVELIVVFLVYFLMQDSWILEKQLDLIANSTVFWTDYGLRSLSKTRWMFYLFCSPFTSRYWNISVTLILYATVPCTWSATQSMTHLTGEAQFGWTWITWFYLHSTTIPKVSSTDSIY